MNGNLFTLPGFNGYGIKGLDGESGMSGNSYHYTPYSVDNDMQIVLDKIRNNFKINEINSFDKLPDDRVYLDKDLICDNKGRVYIYKVGADELESTDIILNIKSIFQYSTYENVNRFLRAHNYKYTSINGSIAKSSHGLSDIVYSTYHNFLLDFNNIIFNDIIKSSKCFANKIYHNGKCGMYIYKNRDIDEFTIGSDKNTTDLHLIFKNLIVPKNTSYGESNLNTEDVRISKFKSFVPDYINNHLFNISFSSSKGCYTMVFNPPSFFTSVVDYSTLLIDVTVFSKNNSNLKCRSIHFNDLEFLEGYRNVKFNLGNDTDVTNHVFITIKCKLTGNKVVSKIRKL